MAVGAAQNAAASVASGSAAAGGASSSAGALGAVVNNSGSTATATAATAVVAAAAYYATTAGGVPLLCPNIESPDILAGRVSFDFLGLERRPDQSEGLNMTTSFIGLYDDIFGCNSSYARRLVNCSLPCFEEQDGNFSKTVCCEEANDSLFSEFLRCTFDCFVHCDGCAVEEPLFLDPGPAGVFPSSEPSSRSPGSDTARQRFLDENDESESPLYLVGRGLEAELCSDGSSCRVIRSFVYSKPAGLENSTFSALSDVVTGQTFLPFPSSVPSTEPSSIPSTSPSKSPSVNPTSMPSGLPTTTPTESPSKDPSAGPSVSPSTRPSKTPTNRPSSVPSPSPTREPKKMGKRRAMF